MKPATTIDGIISQLEDIITAETAAKSTLAFFPVLYKKVTERIKLGIQNKEFEDNHRMERLDIIFASRYIDAYHQFKKGETPSQSWQVAFDATKDKIIIMQHLLLGMNAHINLDLGIAVAETVGAAGSMDAIHNDYNKINDILATMVNGVQESISEVSPVFYLLEKVGKGKEDKIVTFSIDLARDGAWVFANQYHISNIKAEEISARDIIIAALGNKLITTKSRFLRWTIRFIRFFESKNVAKIVAVLGR